MSQECANCKCSDKSQCVKKANSIELDPVYVYAKPPQIGDNIYIPDSPHLRESFQDYKGSIDIAININQSIFEQMSSKFHSMAKNVEKNFDKNNKHSYKKAQEIYKKVLNNPSYKLKQSDIESVRNALSLEQLKDIQRNADSISNGLKVIGKISERYDVLNALVQSAKEKDWRPLFDTATSIGAGRVVAFMASFITPAGVVGAIAVAGVSALASYYLTSEQIQSWREEIERKFF